MRMSMNTGMNRRRKQQWQHRLDRPTFQCHVCVYELQMAHNDDDTCELAAFAIVK